MCCPFLLAVLTEGPYALATQGSIMYINQATNLICSINRMGHCDLFRTVLLAAAVVKRAGQPTADPPSSMVAVDLP